MYVHVHMISYSSRDRQDEIDSMSGPDEFREFYRRLKRLNEHYSE